MRSQKYRLKVKSGYKLGLILAIVVLVAASFYFYSEAQASFGVRQKDGYMKGYLFEDVSGNGTRALTGEPNVHRTDDTYYTITYSCATCFPAQSGSLYTDGTGPTGYNINPVPSFPVGSYTVTLTLIKGMTATTAVTRSFPVLATETAYFNFGVQLHRLTGYVWEDVNGNAVFDSGDEYNMAGRTLTGTLTGSCSPNCSVQVVTDATSKYEVWTKGPMTDWNTDKPPPAGEWSQTNPTGPASIPSISQNGSYRQDFGLHHNSGGSITGFVWDDLDRDSLYDLTEEKISVSGFQVGAYDSGGIPQGSLVNPDAFGAFTFSNLPSGSGYELRLTIPADIGYSIGNELGGFVGWNDGTNDYPYVAPLTSPYKTGNAITVPAGSPATANLGALTDFNFNRPADEILIVPGGGIVITTIVDPDPTWVDDPVHVEFVPISWPSSNPTLHITGDNPKDLNPNNGSDHSQSLNITADAGLPVGEYDYTLTVSHATTPVRSKVFAGKIVVAASAWFQVQDADVYTAYTGLGDAISLVLPETPTGGYESWLVAANGSPWGSVNLGGFPTAPKGITILKSSGQAYSERGWRQQNYNGAYPLSFSATDFAGVSNNCTFSTNSLPAGGACQLSGSLPSSYDLDGPGVTVIFVPATQAPLDITSNFLSAATNERVVLVVDGNVQIDGTVGVTGAIGASPNIQALILTLGDRDIVIEDTVTPNWQLKVAGGLYAGGLVDNQRKIASGNLPSYVVNNDAIYFDAPIFGITQSRVIWREVSPLKD